MALGLMYYRLRDLPSRLGSAGFGLFAELAVQLQPDSAWPDQRHRCFAQRLLINVTPRSSQIVRVQRRGPRRRSRPTHAPVSYEGCFCAGPYDGFDA